MLNMIKKYKKILLRSFNVFIKTISVPPVGNRWLGVQRDPLLFQLVKLFGSSSLPK